MSSDRIEKKILLHAPQSRVWRAISDSREFGSWFGARLQGPFVAGAAMRGVIAPTSVDPEIAQSQKPYEGTPFEIQIERIEPERLLSFRWHPYGVKKGVDYSREPLTLVTFVLEAQGDGTLLTVTESGFDRIPLARRAKAFEMNDGGWAAQMKLIEKYLLHAS
jgi:uncharacterized protein YndB with AHSA1/START domain